MGLACEQVATAPALVKAINIRTMTKEDATFKVRRLTLQERAGFLRRPSTPLSCCGLQ